MWLLIRRGTLTWCLLLGWAACGQAAEPTAADLEFFETKVRPLLVTHCYDCHSEAKKIQGNLRLDLASGWLEGGDSGPAIVPGEPDNSPLILAIRYTGSDIEMPPKGKLPAEDIQLLEEWVKRGAPAPSPAAPQPSKKRELDLTAARQFWAYRPLAAPAIPQSAAVTKSHSAIDHFVVLRLEQAQLRLNPPADKATLLRRLTFDLHGLPPTPDEITSFIADTTSDATEKLVDRLLDSPRFGERWGRHWLDIVRYGESLTLRGFILPEAWRYRDYVIDHFNNDRPYDQFLREQIAGDLLPHTDLPQQQRQLIATTFLTLGNTNLEEQDKAQLDMDVVDEQLDTIGKAFLAQTIGCARCHDHKFDPIPTRDYYALAGILRNSQALTHANVSQWMEVPLPLPPEMEAQFAQQATQLAEKQAALNAVKQQVAALKEQLTPGSSSPGVIPANTLAGIVVDDVQAKKIGDWKTSQVIKPYVEQGYLHDDNSGKGDKTLTFAPQLPANGKYEVRLAYSPGDSRSRKVPVTIFSADGEREILVDQQETPPINGKFLSLGTYQFEVTGQSFVLIANAGTQGHVTADAVLFIPQQPVPQVATSDSEKPASTPTAQDPALVAQLTARQDELKQLTADLTDWQRSTAKRPMVMTLVERPQITDTAVHIRGSVHTLGETVPRGFLQVVTYNTPPQLPPQHSGRLELAQWLTTPENPLPARVMVNRVWHWLFGQGLVRTPDNFGTTGEAPSHPELLDHLALRFQKNGWSTKQLIREIVLSQTYQQASTESQRGLQADPENRLLWRMNRKRLEAEALRDTLLAISGQLEFSMGGSLVPPTTSSDFGLQLNSPRRSVYLPVLRNSIPELFEAFDGADPSLVVGRRNVSTVAPQALFFLNHPFVSEQAQAAAKRLLETPLSSSTERLTHAYLRTLGRNPIPTEQQLFLAMLEQAPSTPAAQQQAWNTVFHLLFAGVDFRYRD